MKKLSVKVHIVALLPTSSDCGLFLSDGEKVILIHIDPSIGSSLNDALIGEQPSRPQTHDFFHQFLVSSGAEMIGAYIVREEDEVFFACATFRLQDEMRRTKIIQLDCRLSDCLSMAVRADLPMLFLKDIWDRQPDSSSILNDIKRHIDSLDE